MYFPYLRGRQFELIALRELLEGKRISEKVIPIIEPVKPSSTLLKTLETSLQLFVVNGIKMNQSYLTRRLQYENSFRRIQWNNNVS